ncbi:anthrone oxygenase family protein [Pseudoprimorskyibacter insulae]|uniref:DUF1772 domain-containing protein n=1 Tax=Pseudoprimorskyibacter insulae TaxID=1695997 RepID=A0A2R8AXL1_9RHOB|nr:anthrone oxygenase family protein [Pseudoprimorskyibacter insulae]SPF80614.1 hypothetical protein PRI8871_02424 [Pseudoprimorskyibacter insulae]
MQKALIPTALLGLLLTGAIFGFFYAWVCSTMWGLDAIDPHVAIQAMNGMNASVRNAVFAPAFFGTPFVLGSVAQMARKEGHRQASWLFNSAAMIYLLLGVMLTGFANVPMNEALAATALPDDPAAAAQIWAEYSPRWQMFNIIRTAASGVSLLLVGLGLLKLR